MREVLYGLMMVGGFAGFIYAIFGMMFDYTNRYPMPLLIISMALMFGSQLLL